MTAGFGPTRAVVVHATVADLNARRRRALAHVRLTEAKLIERVRGGRETPDEADAWREVDTVRFLLGEPAVCVEGCCG